MLGEVLTFFGIASLLSTLLCVTPRAPAARPMFAVPAVLVVIAAGAALTAFINADPLGGEILGGVGVVLWLAVWLRLSHWGAAAAAMLAMLVFAAITYLAYAAVQTVAQAGGPIFDVASVVLLVLEVLALGLSLSYAFEILDVLGRRTAALPPPPLAGDPPFVALQVPTYNEPVDIVRITLESLARLDYPRLIVQVVDNNTSDPAIWKPLESLCQQLGPRFQFLHLENWPGFKAGALNEATKRLPAEVEVVGIIDADYVVEPAFLQATALHFADPTVAFVQSAQHYRDWEDDRYLRGLFYSFRYFFDVTMPARANRNAIIFCGTMGLIRRSVLEKIGGWNQECITEDSECSLRILGLAERYVGIYDPRPWGAGLMPLSFDGLKKQRHRWALGGIQILRMHWRELLPFARHRMHLTTAQRIHYFLGSAQWFGDLLTVVFTVLLILTAVAAALHHQLPIRQITGAVLVIPVLFLVTGVLRALWALRRTTGCGWGDAVRALRVWFALSWVVSGACARGLIRTRATFLRTPKRKEGEASLLRALRFATVETMLAFGAAVAAVAMLALSFSVATVLLSILLFFEAFVYGSAPWAAAAAEGIPLTPLRRSLLRSSQNTGERPSRAPAVTAVLASGAAAALLALAATFVATAPPEGSPSARGPQDLPPLGQIGKPQSSSSSTPSPAPSPAPSSTAAATPSPTVASVPSATSAPTPSGGTPTPAPTP